MALIGGARILQYRNKHGDRVTRLREAREIRSLCSEYEALFIVNDDVELAARVGADGVHIGQDDGAIRDARQQLGSNAVIGASCYDQFALAEQVRDDGADYIAFGRIYPSVTKPGDIHAPLSLLQQSKALHLPVCAIGGITTENARPVVEAGADMVAVINGLFASDDIVKAAQTLSSLFPSESGV